LLCLSPAATAQDLNIVKPALVASTSTNHETLDSSAARLAVKAALHPSAPPTRQELLGAILIMSLREQRASGI
jgi:hypothetical protein